MGENKLTNKSNTGTISKPKRLPICCTCDWKVGGRPFHTLRAHLTRGGQVAFPEHTLLGRGWGQAWEVLGRLNCPWM